MPRHEPLFPCPSCHRHLFVRSEACPFCGVHLALARVLPAVLLGASAVLAAGCKSHPAASTDSPDAAATPSATAESSAPASSESSPAGTVSGRGMGSISEIGGYGPLATMVDPLGPKGTVDVIKVEGDTSRVANAERVLAGAKARFRRCYMKGLAANPNLQGLLKLTVPVSASGEVTNVTVKPGHGLTESVAQCIIDRITSAQFDAPTGSGAAKLTVTLKFAPTKSE